MHRVTLAGPDDFEGWRDAARALALAAIPADASVILILRVPPCFKL